MVAREDWSRGAGAWSGELGLGRAEDGCESDPPVGAEVGLEICSSGEGVGNEPSHSDQIVAITYQLDKDLDRRSSPKRALRSCLEWRKFVVAHRRSLFIGTSVMQSISVISHPFVEFLHRGSR